MASMHITLSAYGTALAIVLSAQQAGAQVFVNTPGNIPQGAPFNNSLTEQVDFADIDLDGDWDCGIADGAEVGNDQNRLWVNLGGLQGGTLGFFADVTDTQAPAISDQSHDIEFVDFDGDGDPDVHVSNSSDISNQPCRWWTNQGGLQAGTAGFYLDETAIRWVGVGAPGSSVAQSLVLPSGGFITWPQDQDFADVDGDGDLDLVALAMSPLIGDKEPTRVFLNDGRGFFSEFNPSGFQLGTATISNGDPALWCEGLQQSNTTNTSGAFADIATFGVEVSLGDIDGDLDVDVLLTDIVSTPRMFRNRLESGVLAFSDATGATWAPPLGGSRKYEQDFGDFDGDADLDLFRVNGIGSRFSGLSDTTLRGAGDGTFEKHVVLSGTETDDDACDFIDYEGDGDLDIYVAGFLGSEKLLANNFAGGPLVFSIVANAVSGLPHSFSRDVDVADTDGDGDYDLMRASDQVDAYLQNVLNVPDTTAPRLARLEQPADHNNGLATRIRVQVYDNAPDYLTGANATELAYWVDNGTQLSAPMAWSGAQIFRGELPAAAVGNVRYQVTSTDEHGNSAVSVLKAIDTGGGCSGQPSTYCTGKLNSDGCVAAMDFQGAPKAGGLTTFLIRASLVPAGMDGFLIYSKFSPAALPFSGGVLCVGSPLVRGPFQNAGGSGACGGLFSFDFNAWIVTGGDVGLVPGQRVWAQWWYRDPPSMGSSGLSNALTFTICQ